MVQVNKSEGNLRIHLQPNRSASWRQTKLLVASIGALCLLIAIAWSFAGAWVILPFAGLEVGLLAYLAYRVSCNTYQQELLLINEHNIELQTGKSYPKRHWRFCRQHCQLLVNKAEHSLSPDQLVLQDKYLKVEIGNWLNQEDKETLKKQLRGLMLPVKTFGKNSTTAL